jgi:5'-3' exonuclease
VSRTALIDGDIFIYQASSANEYEAQWSPWQWTLHANLEAAIAQLDDTIKSLKESAEADEIVVALTDSTNFRKSVMPSYKSHRLKTRKPVVYQAMREYVEEVYRTYKRPGLEGDDILGILATHSHLIKGEKVIVSIDKDLKTIPGLHLRIDTQTLNVVSREDADRYHMLQTLTGDPTDGYPGAPGIGPVKAAKLLAEGLVLEPHTKVIRSGPRKGALEVVWVPGRPGSVWEIVVSAYQSVGLGEEAALQNARVARILRASDYDFATKEVKLWLPSVAAA